MVRSMKNEKGFTLIEVVIALLLLGIIASGFLMALSGTTKALILADERTTAESLARSQMEYVKNSDYELYGGPGALPLYTKEGDESSTHPGYFIWIDAFPIDPDTGELLIDPDTGEFLIEGDTDKGIQKITVTIQHPLGEDVIALEDYKVDR